jgi:hypothetical protein
MLQASDIANWGKTQKTTLLKLLLDFICDLKPTPHWGRGPILQTMARIARIVSNSLYVLAQRSAFSS